MRVLIAALVWLTVQIACAQGTPAAAPPSRASSAPLVLPELDGGGKYRAPFARAGAFVGLLGAGLVLGGSIAIASMEDGDRVALHAPWLAVTVVLPPFVSLAAWTARKQSDFRAYPKVRQLGFTLYSGAVATGVAQLYGVVHGRAQPRALTVTGGVLAALALLPLAFDAYVSARYARLRRLRLMVTPLGLAGRF